MMNSLLLSRVLTRRVVADALQTLPMTSGELARHSGSPQHAIDAAVAELKGEGWILIDEKDGTGGKLRLAADAAYVLGVDVGGTKIAAALADITGKIIAELAEPTDARGSSHVLDQIRDFARHMAKAVESDVGRIQSVVVGFPGAIDPFTDRIALAPNIRGLDALDIRRELSCRVNGSIALENDVNLAALGEMASGCAQNHSNIAFLSLGTGTGLGLIVEGRLVRGASGGAGEIAYLPIGTDTTSPEALRVGAFEHGAGSVAMLRRYRSKGEADVTSVREIFDRLKAGDPVAAEVLDETARSVALAITALQAILDLDLIVLGGSIGVRPELAERVHFEIGKIFARPVRIAVSELGSRAGLVGAVAAASALQRDQVFGPLMPPSVISGPRAFDTQARTISQETASQS